MSSCGLKNIWTQLSARNTDLGLPLNSVLCGYFTFTGFNEPDHLAGNAEFPSQILLSQSVFFAVFAEGMDHCAT